MDDKEFKLYLDKYFNTLIKYGEFKYKNVFKLLILLFLHNLKEGSMKNYITEDDQRIIDKATECIKDSFCAC